MRRQQRKFRIHHFTLIEVVVVIIILVTLASVATPVYLNYVRKACLLYTSPSPRD